MREIFDCVPFLFAGIDVNCITPVGLYSLFEGIEDDRSDPSNINQKQITVAHEIRKIFLVYPIETFSCRFEFCIMMVSSLEDFLLWHSLLNGRFNGGRFQITRLSIGFSLSLDTVQSTRPCECSLLQTRLECALFCI